jgi:hypothetical protein
MAHSNSPVIDNLRRAGAVIRDYATLLEPTPLLILPVSAELPFPDNLDLRDFHRVWSAQLTQIALPLTGLPALTISTGITGTRPSGCSSSAPGSGRTSASPPPPSWSAPARPKAQWNRESAQMQPGNSLNKPPNCPINRDQLTRARS